MDLNLNPFDDTPPRPTGKAGSKFKPTAKSHPRKKAHTTISTNTNASKDISIKTTAVHQDCSPSMSVTPMLDPVTCNTTLTDPSPDFQDQEPLDSTVIIDSEPPFPAGDRSASVDLVSPHLMHEEYADSRYSLYSGCTVFNSHGDIQLQRGTADNFFGLDNLIDGCITANGKSFEEGPDRHLTDTSPELAPLETANSSETGAFDNEENFLFDVGRVEREEQAFPGFESLNVDPNTTSAGVAESFPSEIDYRDDDLHSASVDHDFADLSAITTSNCAVPEHPSELSADEYLADADASMSYPPVPPETSESQAVPIISRKENARSRRQKSPTLKDIAMRVRRKNVANLSQDTQGGRPSVQADEGNKCSKSSKRLRKRSSAPVLADETECRTEEHMVEEDVHNAGDDNYQQGTSCHKRTAKKAKPSGQNEKAGRRSKVSSEGPDSSCKEPSQKRNSLTTRRRELNKILLETPDDEIDLRKLPLKDIILLAELREENMKKDPATSKKALPSRSGNTYFSEDAPYDDDDNTFGVSDDVEKKATPIHNYHSLMKKRPKKKWSKQHTELFYQAIRQFGTDFTMIDQVFPDDDDLFPENFDRRRQLVLKFKSEERKNPKKIQDALTRRSKDHSHFEMVIEKLQRAAQEKETCEMEEMESVEEAAKEEDNHPETNEEVQLEQNGEIPDDMETTVTHEDDFNWKEDDYGFGVDAHNWSNSKDEYDDW